MIHKRSIVLLKILVLLVPIVISFEVSQNEDKKDSKIAYLGKEFRYSIRRINRITFGQHKSDNNNRLIQLTDVFCILFIFHGASNWITLSG